MTQAPAFPDKRRRFFGSNIDLLTMDETVVAVEKIIEHGQPNQHVVINVAKLMMMRRDPDLKSLVNSCPVINVDGQGVVWARWLGIKVPERVAGIDLFLNLVRLSAEKGHRVYFLGATDEVVGVMVKIFRKELSSLPIAGYRNGYFSDSDEAKIAEQIRASNADLLFVAISSPKKEFFLERNLLAMNVPFTMGVGGSFDVVAGKTKRAPAWMQLVGLEWFYRFLNEPRRMWKRYLTSNAVFMWLLIKATMIGKKKCDCD